MPDFPELDGLQGIDAMNLTFDPDFRGDRAFALVVGLGSMLRRPTAISLSCLSTTGSWRGPADQRAQRGDTAVEAEAHRKPNRDPYLVTYEYRGVIDT